MAQLAQTNHDKDAAIENLKKSRLSNKEWFDKHKRLRPETVLIHTNNLVLLYDTKLDNQHTDKLADRWGGPYKVLKILGGGTYVLAELDGARLDGTFAGNRLKKYWQRPTKEEETNKKGNENGRNATQIDEVEGKEAWPLPGRIAPLKIRQISLFCVFFYYYFSFVS